MTNMHIAAILACAMSFGAATPALAQQQVVLASDVYVERTDAASRLLEPARKLVPGDRVVTIVTWKRTGAVRLGSSGQFVVTNPLPRTVYFQGSADGNDEVSINGGRTWGQLGNLRIGDRLASAEDVTHIRWRIATPAPQGRIAYSAIVR
ncbi:MAG: hypothetical protein FP826_03310 [Sphingomonadales bacterium]|nr:hypothetical protein [Sphingomonadales bacterium]MBU3992271.1 hypothetical protein [Alphaproteobacteria bacterium]